MKLRIFGSIAILAAFGAYILIIALAERWMEHLRHVNDNPFGYYGIGMLPFIVPFGVLLLVSLWHFGPVIGQAIVDWLRK